MLYSDGIHLIADSREELFRYCDSIGLRRCWFDSHWRHPHYDLVNKQGDNIVNREGVVVRDVVMHDQRVKQVSPREIVNVCRVTYCFPQNAREMEEWEAKWGPPIEDRDSITITELMTKEAFNLEELTKIKRK